MASEPGWYPDPQGRHEYRYHDGDGWTDDVSDAGAVSKDPLVVLPGPGEAVGAAAPAAPPGLPPGPATEARTGTDAPGRSRRRWWLVGGLAGAVAAVAVVVVLSVSGGDDAPSDPLVGVFDGGGDEVDVSLVVDGDPPALSELSVSAACGPVSSSQTIEFSPSHPIDDGRFEVVLPPPGGIEIDGTFVDGGRRVEGHVVAGGCDEDWSAELVDGDAASGGTSDDADSAGPTVTPGDVEDPSDPTVPGDDGTADTTVPDDGGTADTTVPDDDSSEPTVPDGDDTADTTVPDDEDDDDVPVDSTVFRDDFDGLLDTGWEWLNENPRRWSLDTRTGWVSITADDTTPRGIANVLARAAPVGDDTELFVLTTRVAFEPTSNFQFAGLFVSGQDPDTDRVQFGRAYCDLPVCAGDGLYLDRVEGGELVGDNAAVPFADTPELYLQLVVAPGDGTGAEVFAAFSVDGEEWFGVGSHAVDFEVVRIGLVAHQAPVEITAHFDFFESEAFGG